MERDKYEEQLFEMRRIASYVLSKLKKKRSLFQADRKRIRLLKEELRRNADLANYCELLRQEKSEAARRFLLLAFIFLFTLFLQKKRDQKAALELRQYLERLQAIENAWQISQNMKNFQKRKLAMSPSTMVDVIAPAI